MARFRTLPLALLTGGAAAVLGTWAWVQLHEGPVFGTGWIALPISIGIALAVVLAARGRRGPMLQIVGAGFVALAMLASQNFAQRQDLQAGIVELQKRWPDLRVDAAPAAFAGATDTESGADPSTESSSTPAPASSGPPPTLAGGGPAPTAPPGVLVPPPAIAKILPIEALLTISPEVLAVVWEYIPDDRKAQLPPETVAAVEALLANPAGGPVATDGAAAGGWPATATETPTTLDELAAARERIAAARAQFDQDQPDIPRPVLVCAPPPDFTQPDAAAGLGFPQGVPLVLPLSDFYRDRVRGDGQTFPAPSPVCFAREAAKDRPLQALFWGLGLVAALIVPSRAKLLRSGRRVSYDDLVRSVVV